MPIYSYKIESYLPEEIYKNQFVCDNPVCRIEYHVNGSAGYLVLCRNLDIHKKKFYAVLYYGILIYRYYLSICII